MHSSARIVQTLCLVAFLSALLVLAGCTYHRAVGQLPPQEQAEFRAHRQLMSPGQIRAYLAKPTPEARAAYLEEIGSTQRFAALDQADRESVLAGQVRTGMSAEALRFLWGHPFRIEGYLGHYEYWCYSGSPVELADSTEFVIHYGLNLVRVYLVDGQLEW